MLSFVHIAARTIFASAIICCSPLTVPALSQPAKPVLTIYTENYEPFYFRDENGEIAGQITYIVRELADESGITLKIRLAPFKRGLLVVKNKPNYCFMALWRTEARTPNFQWVGPLQIDGFAYFALKDSDISILQHKDTFEYHTGAVAGWTSTQEAQKAGHPRLTLVDDDGLNLEMLSAGRVKLWLGGLLSAPYIAQKRGVEIKNVFTLRTVDLSLACNPNTDSAILGKLRRTLKSIY